jgi:hypothetical protein
VKEKGLGRPEGAPTNQNSVSPKEQAKSKPESAERNPLIFPIKQKESNKLLILPPKGEKKLEKDIWPEDEFGAQKKWRRERKDGSILGWGSVLFCPHPSPESPFPEKEKHRVKLNRAEQPHK